MEDLRATVQLLLDRVASLESNRLKTSAFIEGIEKRLPSKATASNIIQAQDTKAKRFAEGEAGGVLNGPTKSYIDERLVEIGIQKSFLESRLENCEKSIVTLTQQQNILVEKSIQNDLNFKIKTQQVLDEVASHASSTGQIHSELKSVKEENKALKVTIEQNFSALKTVMEERLQTVEKEAKEVAVMRSEMKPVKEETEALKVMTEERISTLKTTMEERLVAMVKKLKDKNLAQGVPASSVETRFAKVQEGIKDHLIPLSWSEYKQLAALEGIVGSSGKPATDKVHAMRGARSKERFDENVIVHNLNGVLKTSAEAMEDYVSICNYASYLANNDDVPTTKYFRIVHITSVKDWQGNWMTLAIGKKKMGFLDDNTKQFEESWNTICMQCCRKLRTKKQDDWYLELALKKVARFKDGSKIYQIWSTEEDAIQELISSYLL